MTSRDIWNTFTRKDKCKCAENNYSCLKWGTYGYLTPRYFCGCEQKE